MRHTLSIELKMAWWFWPYAYCLAVWCAITGIEPDEKKLSRVIDRAIRIVPS